jgi:hypothetical protein
MYFSAFPKIYYDFPNADNSDTFLKVLTDITANVRIRKNILEDITLYDEYDIKEGETPEIIAERIYGNPEYHWIIMLANQRYDHLNDFPLTSAELYEYVVDKYGVDNINNVHHYERDGLVDEAIAVLKIPTNVIDKLKVNDFISAAPIANARVESIDKINKTVVIRMDYGRFKSGDLVTLSGVRTDSITKVRSYSAIANFNIAADGFSINENYNAITNYDYENAQNESKRRIKIISPQLIAQILNEYKKIMY